MQPPVTVERRKELATQLGLSDAYLYQCLSGRRDMNPSQARALELASNGELHRRHLCQKTWEGIWPELATERDHATSPSC